MTDEYVKETCKIGQGADCCKYLAMGMGGWECLKVIPPMKLIIDARTDMTAQSDNCEGVEND